MCEKLIYSIIKCTMIAKFLVQKSIIIIILYNSHAKGMCRRRRFDYFISYEENAKMNIKRIAYKKKKLPFSIERMENSTFYTKALHSLCFIYKYFFFVLN